MPRSARPSGCTVGSGRLSIRIGADVVSRNCVSSWVAKAMIAGMRVEAVGEVLGDQMPGPQGADEDGVVLAFADKPNIVGKSRRHMQIDAAPRRFPAQEIGFHLDIAIAEQDDIDALSAGAEIVEAVGGADRPIGRRAFLQVAPIALEDFGRIAPMLGRKFGADRGQFLAQGSFRSGSGAPAGPIPCARPPRADRSACRRPSGNSAVIASQSSGMRRGSAK